MAHVDIPNFGELLAEHLGGVPPAAYPYLLSQLERSAAARYRALAEAVEQMTIQAGAERQGATAWQTLKSAYPEHAEALDALSSIELESAAYLDGLLQTLGTSGPATR